MLSRVAQRLYWIGRFIENAENLTRILDVYRQMDLEKSGYDDIDVWTPILQITESLDFYKSLHPEVSEREVVDFLLFSEENPHSTISSVFQARESAKNIRNNLSEEIWLHLNVMYHGLKSMTLDQNRVQKLDEFHNQILVFCNCFHGLVDNSMIQAQGWQWLRLGRYYQRAITTVNILKIKYFILLPSLDDVGSPVDLHQWMALLKAASAHEAYRRIHQARIDPVLVADLLVNTGNFPRSIAYSVDQVNLALSSIAKATNHSSSKVLFTLDRLRELLHYSGGMTKVFGQGYKEYLDEILKELTELQELVDQNYFNSLKISRDRGSDFSLDLRQLQQQQQFHC